MCVSFAFATNHASHVHLSCKRKPWLEDWCKSWWTNERYRKNSQASWQETEILAFSESDVGPPSYESARPIHEGKKKRTALRETSRQEQGRFKMASPQIGHPCSRLKKRAKRVGNSEQVGIFPNQGAAHQHSKTGRGQKERRNQ